MDDKGPMTTNKEHILAHDSFQVRSQLDWAPKAFVPVPFGRVRFDVMEVMETVDRALLLTSEVIDLDLLGQIARTLLSPRNKEF